ncbi:oxysterol binding protein (Osh1), putative [Talaromyces stipitatus ATCC 10500]|uniref:Oxysterol binding protein (Osh1), putative n=1 Tax=Talaromyces stipitatus (strain ATCC 10500 / CBS 375.48 / QM 6759 / NRRL 1006) TaxID=441959 RepID=B8MTX7_TALSN|nr:oxysterol binding protein (Osh1), putative [Talaromyces stipitatus ATCC 10500]EED12591.1 oxysterol binding protein (Osh1), putative [Talaromyces stipitatus ATCC 10500]
MESPSVSGGDISSHAGGIDSPEKPGSIKNNSETHTTSIEQSVKTFRLFEILRSGDTTAISKALREAKDQSASGGPGGTTILHLAIQCADLQVVEYVMASGADIDVNARDREGNTPLHLAAQLGRDTVVQSLLDLPQIDDSIANYRGQTALDVARTPELFEKLQLARSLFIDTKTKQIQDMVVRADYEGLEKLLEEPRVQGNLDVNALELVTDTVTAQSGGTLLHEGARKKDTKLLQILLLHGADPFRRDKKGKLPQDVTKDDKTRAIVKKSPAAIIAQRGIQERAILGNAPSQAASSSRAVSAEVTLAGKDAREMKGYLKKWTNYTSGFKLRWFVLEDGVLSYYKHQDDAGSACRGAISMRIAKLHMDAQDKTRFEIHGKSSVKYHLKANHVVEAKRWFWALNNAIQWAKDEAKEEEKRRTRDAEFLQAKIHNVENRTPEGPVSELTSVSSKLNVRGGPAVTDPRSSFTRVNTHTSRNTVEPPGDDEASAYGSYAQSVAHTDMNRAAAPSGGLDGEADYEDYNDYASSHDAQPSNKDAFYITAQSAKLQLDLLSNVSASLLAEKHKNPELTVSDPAIDQALSTYESAVCSLHDLLANLMKISRDRDAYWQYRLDKESDTRKMWEESMAQIVREHEELQLKVGESEEKRKRTKKALKEVLEKNTNGADVERVPFRGNAKEKDIFEEAETGPETADYSTQEATVNNVKQVKISDGVSRRQTISEYIDLAESDSEDEDEFFDAIDKEEVEVGAVLSSERLVESETVQNEAADLRAAKLAAIESAYKGYEDPVRTRLNMDKDDRPKLSLWGILKSMIGKDMTKMTLPVSFNEPTSLLQRVAEDMEYADLLDMAADRTESLERLLYVAAYAISEYASTIGRVAKPFNPLLGETFEYTRPDKQYRFYVEQVSHHPPIGAAWAESPRWDYFGESALKSKFYGKSFDINLLGTWFCKLRPITGEEELYTWKKVTSSVIGIITGNPTVDNYGPMEVRNWKTGEVCYLDFKARGWKASSAYQVTGKVVDAAGVPRWSIGGRWNDKIFARPLSGHEGTISEHDESSKAILLWQANPRPSGIPFNLTPFVITLNAIPDRLRPFLPPTDTRLRPDQRAMEDGEYDFAAAEKHRVEEKQRAKRREREKNGEEFVPQWFQRAKCPITGEEYWHSTGEYWRCREVSDWSNAIDLEMVSEYTCSRCIQALKPHIHHRMTLSTFRRLPSQASRRCNFSTTTGPRSSPVRIHNGSNGSQFKTIKNSFSVAVDNTTATTTRSSLLLPTKQVARNVHSAAAIVTPPTASRETAALRRPDNLFHHYSSSPSSIIRKRAAFIKQNAFCPHPSHQQTRAPLGTSKDDVVASATLPPAHSHFECPDCGVPLYCSEEHWMDDYEAHLEVCDTIRQINEDDHDLVSGRFFPEFSYPGPQDDNFVVNMTNWDTFLYTREFEAIDNERSMRQVTRMLTYPVTIASIIHELSPYTVHKEGRLTTEGLKSFSALRYTLHPPKQGEGKDIRGLRLKAPPVRIFILGARAESSLPREVWLQLTHMFPNALINLIFIGPESMANRDDEFPLPERTPSNPFGGIVEDRLGPQMKITTYVDYFHTMHDAQYFYPYDPYFDCFMLFHPGLGHPASSHEWAETLPKLLETKVPIICTGYTQSDLERDINWVREKCAGEFDVLLEPGENRFRSLRWDLNDMDPSDVSAGNWGVWAFRGKRYVICSVTVRGMHAN